MKLTNQQVWLLIEILRDSLEVGASYTYVFKQSLAQRKGFYDLLIKQAVLDEDKDEKRMD